MNCFARALVSAKAFVDQDPQYENISQGRGLQGHLAYKLHQETGVPEGMCGLKNCVCLKWNSIFTDYEVCQPS